MAGHAGRPSNRRDGRSITQPQNQWATRKEKENSRIEPNGSAGKDTQPSTVTVTSQILTFFLQGSI